MKQGKTLRGALVAATVLVLLGARPSGAAYTTLVNNGAPENRVDIVFIGDGYTQADIDNGTYDSDINALVQHMFGGTEDPFPRYQNFFNIHKIDVVSNQSGADIPDSGVYVDTALGATYGTGANDRLLTVNPGSANLALSAGLSGAFTADIKPITVNSSKYGGSGVYNGYAVYAGGYAGAGYGGAEIALHEMGHSFGNLADEYYTYAEPYPGFEPFKVNVTLESDPAASKWADWTGYTDPDHPGMSAVGLYEGGANYEYGIYRPTENSKMKALGQPFNAVCREALILKIYDCVEPLDVWLDDALTYTPTTELWVDVVDPTVIAVEWYVDGAHVPGANGETFTLADYGLTHGVFDVTARAYDTALGDWVRRDEDNLEMSVTWAIQGNASEPASVALIGVAVMVTVRRRRK